MTDNKNNKTDITQKETEKTEPYEKKLLNVKIITEKDDSYFEEWMTERDVYKREFVDILPRLYDFIDSEWFKSQYYQSFF